MKRSFFAGLALLALVSAAPASAADLPRAMPYKAPAYVTSYNWTGFYVGTHAGYGWASSDGFDARGGFIGGQVGYNWQPMGSPWVFGVEVDSAWADIGRSSTFFVPAGLLSVSSNANYQGSLRGRVGYAFDRTMIYATGGLGWINNEVKVNAAVGPFVVGAERQPDAHRRRGRRGRRACHRAELVGQGRVSLFDVRQRALLRRVRWRLLGRHRHAHGSRSA